MDEWKNFKGLFNRFCSLLHAIIAHESTPNHTAIKQQKIDNYEAIYSQGMASISLGSG